MFQGLIPEWTFLNNPVQTQMSFNRDSYINTLIQGLLTGNGGDQPGDYPLSSFNGIADMVWGLPSTTITAFQQVISGDLDAAFATLNAGIIVPIQEALGRGIETIGVVVSQIVGNVVNVLSSIPSLVSSFVSTATGVGEMLAGTAVEAVTQFVEALSSGDFEGAWNAAVEGAWGQYGYAGALETLTIGPGFNNWGDQDYVPSFRVWGQGAILTLANDLGATWPVTPPAPPAESVASVQPAGAIAADEAPVADTSVAEKGIEASAAESAASDAATTVAANAADSAPSAGSSKAGDNDAKGGSDARSGGSDAKASGGKGHARSHGSVRAKADNAA